MDVVTFNKVDEIWQKNKIYLNTEWMNWEHDVFFYKGGFLNRMKIIGFFLWKKLNKEQWKNYLSLKYIHLEWWEKLLLEKIGDESFKEVSYEFFEQPTIKIVDKEFD